MSGNIRKRTVYWTVLVTLLACRLVQPGLGHAATWTSTGPIGGGAPIKAVAYDVNGGVAYAGGVGVLYRSLDGGAAWTDLALPAVFATSFVLSIVPSPIDAETLLINTIDVSTAPTAGVQTLISHNYGLTWTIASGLPNGFSANYSFAWDPHNRLVAYATEASSNVVYRTTNGGASWSMRYQQTMTSSPVPIGPVAIAPTNPSTLYIGAVDSFYFDDDQEYIAQSTNGAASFTDTDLIGAVGLPGYGTVFTTFAISPKSATTVYALASGNQKNNGLVQPYLHFLWTPNGGTNWVERDRGLPSNAEATALAVQRADGRLFMPLCCTPHYGLFQSTDAGAVWSGVNLIPSAPSTLAVQPTAKLSPPPVMIAGTVSGVLYGTEGGHAWTAERAGFNQPLFSDVIDDAKARILYVGTLSGVMRSTNGGKTFAAISTGMTDLRIESLALDVRGTHVLYAATETGIYICRDPAAASPSWSEITPPSMRGLHGTYMLSVDTLRAGRLYVANSYSSPRNIFRTDTYGASWVTTGFHDATGNDFPGALIADPFYPNAVLATAQDFGGIYLSTNAGATFTEVYQSNGTKFVIGAADEFNPRTVYLVSTDPNTGQLVLLRSTNGGVSWDSNTSAPPGSFVDITTDPNGSGVYALVGVPRTVSILGKARQIEAAAVYRSVNRAFSWSAITADLPAVQSVSRLSGALLRASGTDLWLAAPLENALLLRSLAAIP